ncbi:MAG: copper amine oxidase N-terminal domain-containing protein [Defluviitaleaceae bacterium]|nr:copper amine oxidase N-terminal domain-containing protein [Defluviitaleaceae bacterium]
MKRKIALLLAFVMVLSILPMSVSAARLGGGTIPTVAAGNITVNTDVNNAVLRNLVFDANAFPIGANDMATAQAVVAVAGLGDSSAGGGLLALATVGTAFGAGGAPAAFAMFPAAVETEILALINSTAAVGAQGEFLSVGSVQSGQVTMVVVLVRDTRTRAIAHIFVHATDNVPAGFGASVPVAFRSANDDNDISANVVATLTYNRGFQNLNSTVTLLQRHSDDFTFDLSDDPVVFNTRTRIPAIEIIEPASLGFDVNAGWSVRLTLDRNFAWDARHNAVATPRIVIATDMGGAAGLRTHALSSAYDSWLVSSTLADVSRERNRELTTATFSFNNANDTTRFADTLLVGDGDMDDNPDGYLWIVATDNARPGDVEVYVELLNDGDVVSSDRVTVAVFANAAIIFELCEDEDLEDYILPSGAREWDMAGQLSSTALTAAGMANAPFDAVIPDSAVEEYHQTAWVVLTETVRGVLPFTGLRDITFEFPEGAQILGVRWETNEGHFVDDQEDEDGDAWFYDGRTRDGSAMDIRVTRNRVTMRPEIGREEGRQEVAELRLQFYVSIEPEFEALYGDELVLYAFGPGFEDGVSTQVAIVHDPMTVEANEITIGDGDVVAAGMFRHIAIDPVYVHETAIGALEWDRTVELYVEENTFFDTITANAVIIRAATVTTDGESGLEVSRPVNVNRGTHVTVTRTSADGEGWIRFSDIEITGLVLPGQSYDITVVGSAAANNHISQLAGTSGWGGWGTVLHGFWVDEPYRAAAFAFDGTDALGGLQAAPELQNGPVTFGLNSSHTTRDGAVVAAPVFVLVPNITNPAYVTSYVAVRAVADLAGFEWGPDASNWDPATQTVTFTDGATTTVTFVAGATTATVNGVETAITAGGLGADARVIGDRMFVPISFFNTLPVPIRVQWNPYGGVIANRSISIFAQ